MLKKKKIKESQCLNYIFALFSFFQAESKLKSFVPFSSVKHARHYTEKSLYLGFDQHFYWTNVQIFFFVLEGFNADTKQAATRPCDLFGKMNVSDQEKSMCLLYTSQHPRMYFFCLSRSLYFLFFWMKIFHWDDTRLWSELADTETAKVHLWAPDKPAPSAAGSGAIKNSWCNDSLQSPS